MSGAKVKGDTVRGWGLGPGGRLLPPLLRQGGRPQAGRHARPHRPPHHGGHVALRPGELGRAQQVHEQGELDSLLIRRRPPNQLLRVFL